MALGPRCPYCQGEAVEKRIAELEAAFTELREYARKRGYLYVAVKCEEALAAAGKEKP